MAPPVDILIITALVGELEALQDVVEGRTSDWTKHGASREYWVSSFSTQDGALRVAASFADRMAGVATAIAAMELTEELRPRVLAMCGVCAGHPEDTIIGDVVLADRVFQHDHGKLTPYGLQGDMSIREIPDRWRRIALQFPQPTTGWYGYAVPTTEAGRWWFLEQLLAGRNALKSTGFSRFLPPDTRPQTLKELQANKLITLGNEAPVLTRKGTRHIREHIQLHGNSVHSVPYKIHVAPIGSGNYVVGDSVIWEQVPLLGQRKAIGIEMEAASIGEVARTKNVDFAVAKAVMDHADPLKTDGAKPFAARVSAEVLLRFLREVVQPENSTSSVSSSTGDPVTSPRGWIHITFDNQRGLESALSGESLGPRDVTSCPKLVEVEELHAALQRRNYAGIAGKSGSGKSLAIFHVAYDAITKGTSVYYLSESVGVGELETFREKDTLLLIDDAHSLTKQTVTMLCGAATENMRVLFAGTDSIPGIIRPIIVDAERAVIRIADEMSQRRDEVRKIVRQIDRHIGEGYLDTPIEKILEEAAKSKTPWQFMFVLGRGHLRCKEVLANLKRSNRADLLLLIISLRQIATYNDGVQREDLCIFSQLYGKDEAWVTHCLCAIRNQGFLFSELGCVKTPHPRLAMTAISWSIQDAWSETAVREYLRKLLTDESLPLRGRAWLIRELHFGNAVMVGRIAVAQEIRNILHQQLMDHDGSDESMASSAWMLDALIRGKNRHSLSLMRASIPWLVWLIHEAGQASGYALYNVINSINNADPDWGQELVSNVNTAVVAK
ncbi:MAG: hypothetical protein AAGF11_25145 [Myxococcota bacterium]